MRVVLTVVVVMLLASPALAFEGELKASLSSQQGVRRSDPRPIRKDG